MTRLIIILALLPLTVFGQSLRNGLVGHWTMEELSGSTLSDVSVAGNTSTMFNSPTVSAGKRGSGRLWNGSNQYAKTAGSSSFTFGTGDYSLSIWFKANSIAAPAKVITRISYNTGVVSDQVATGFYLEVNLIIAHTRSSAGAIIGTSQSFTDTTNWHHVVFVRKSSTAYGWLDGAAMTGANAVPGGNFNCSSTGNVYLGAHDNDAGGASNFFSGLLDEYRIYNRALTDGEVKELYKLGMSRPNIFGKLFEQFQMALLTPWRFFDGP